MKTFSTKTFLVKTWIVAALAMGAVTMSAPMALAGNTSSNSSSNTSSDLVCGLSYRHSHDWSVDSDDGRRRRVLRGSTYIERYSPSFERSYRQRRLRERDDD